MPPDKLINRIKAVLSGDTGHFEIQSLAFEYAEHVMRTRDRVEQCVALIRAGDDYAALQVAESAPPILDIAAQLAFAESAEWLKLCRQNNVPWPPPLDQRGIELVNNLYNRQISESHPLYRDFRQAMRERDDLTALTVLASIIRINPDDKNARREFNRISNKFGEAELRKLGQLLDSGDTEAAFQLAATLENLNLPALFNTPEMVRVRELRTERERAEALADVSETLRQAALLRESDDWRGAIPLIGRCRLLERHNALVLAEDARLQLDGLEQWAAARQALQKTLKVRAETVADTEAALRDVLVPPNTPGGRAKLRFLISRIQPALDAFEEVAAVEPPAGADATRDDPPFAQPDPELLEKARACVATLQRRIRNKNLLTTTAIVAGVLLVALGAFAVFQNYEDENERERMLARMKIIATENRLFAAEEFLRNLKPAWSNNTAFATARTSLDDWVAAQRVNVNKVTHTAESLASRPDDIPPAGLQAALAELESIRDTASLPVDTREDANAKIAAASEHLRTLREKLIAEHIPPFEKQVTNAETELGRIRAMPRAAARLSELEKYQPVLNQHKTTAAALAFLFSEELAHRWKEVNEAFATARTEWSFSNKVDISLAPVRSLAGYYAVLRNLAGISAPPRDTTAGTSGTPSSASSSGATMPDEPPPLDEPTTEPPASAGDATASATPSAPPPAAGPLALLLASEPAMRAPAANVFAPSVLKLWNAALAVPAAATPFLPDSLPPGETTTAENILRNKFLENTFRNTFRTLPLSGSTPDTTLYTLGAPETTRHDIGQNQTALQLQENGSAKSVAYSVYHGRGQSLVQITLSPESQFYAQFSRFYDALSRRASEPLLSLLDRVRDAKVSPLFKAWLQQEVTKIALSRPTEWGVDFSPRFRAAAEGLSRAVGGSELTATAWMFPDRWADRRNAITAYYAQFGTESFYGEAVAWLRVFQHLAKPGFVYAGYVTAERQLCFIPNTVPAGFLVGVGSDGSTVVCKSSDLPKAVLYTDGSRRITGGVFPFVEHSPILMLHTTPENAAKNTRFPASATTPAGGWDNFVFQTNNETAAP